MELATFPVVNSRWKPTVLVHCKHETYERLANLLPKQVFDVRLSAIRRLILKEYPQAWIDTHLFVLAILLVIAAAGFAIIARALQLAMYLPLLILLLPVFIAYWTTRRRGLHCVKLAKFHESLQTCLKDLTVLDSPRQLKWTYRRVRDSDTTESLHLQIPVRKQQVALIIQVYHLHPESRSASDLLPSYNDASQDIVLDTGPITVQSFMPTVPALSYSADAPPPYH